MLGMDQYRSPREVLIDRLKGESRRSTLDVCVYQRNWRYSVCLMRAGWKGVELAQTALRGVFFNVLVYVDQVVVQLEPMA